MTKTIEGKTKSRNKEMPLRINNTKINWTSSDSHYFFNPKHPKAQKLKELAFHLPFLPGHIYLFTSNLGKVCILSKEAFLCSAQAVNKKLKTEKKDSWLISLPLFHVAGLSILARSFCEGFSYKKGLSKWNAKSFQKELQEKKITLCSLVPAQIYDLVQHHLKAPKNLRAALVGGFALSPFLYKKAQGLGWPLLISYGMTETCSQIACSPLQSLNKKTFPKMKLLDHIQIKQSKKQSQIKSKSLLTAYFDVNFKKFYDPKNSKGWFKLQDEILLTGKCISPMGRKDEQIKILGERVDLQKLSFLLEEVSSDFSIKGHLLAVPDSRQGFKLALASSSFDIPKLAFIAKNFNKKVLPFERIHSLYSLNEISKNSLFKARQESLRKQLLLH